MTELLAFALLGIGTGAIYGLLAQGLVIVYRGAGVLNLAQGAFAMVGAFAFEDFRSEAHLPGPLAIVAATVLGAVIGAVTHAVIFRTMRASSPLTKLIAALGLFLTLQALGTLRYGSESTIVASVLPTRTVQPIPGAHVGLDRILIFAIGVVITAALWLVYRHTKFGWMTTAVTENPVTAASLGRSPDVIGSINWTLGSAVAALGGALIAPIAGLQVAQLSVLIIPALAASLASGFVSFPLSYVGGVIIGVVQAEISHYVSTPGWSDAVPFLAISILLVLRGRGSLIRGQVIDRLPKAAPATASRWAVVLLVVALIVLDTLTNPSWQLAFLITTIYAVIGLSVVLLTGYAGQLSLAPFAMAGVGALVASQVAAHYGWPFLACLVLGGLAAGLVGVVVGLPALRTRGASLAIITLGVGAAIDSVVFESPKYTGGQAGVVLPAPSLFGIKLDTTAHQSSYAILCAVVLGLLFAAVVNVRRGSTGRQLLAVRANERAAASLGISVAGSKLYAFTVSSVIAGIGGVLLAFQNSVLVMPGQFGVFQSIAIVGLVVVGSVGYPGGAVVGAVLVAGALGSRVLDAWFSVDKYLPLIGGLGVLLTVMAQPDGLVATSAALLRGVTRPARRRGRSTMVTPPDTAQEWERPEPQLLVIDGVTVRYGGVVAIDDVSLRVEPGRIVGLIGPNGAGKTSLIDAVTGATRHSGRVVLGERGLSGTPTHRRARAGLGRSFQSLELFEDMTVLENLVAAASHSPVRAVLDIVKPRRVHVSAVANSAIREFGLQDVLHRYPRDLSFGQRRLVGIARAVCSAPSVLLLDEPGAGLDVGEIEHLGRLITRLAHDLGVGILLVEHHLEMVFSICDELYVLDFGHLIAHGSPAEVSIDPRVIGAYTGTKDSSRSSPDAAIGEPVPAQEGAR